MSHTDKVKESRNLSKFTESKKNPFFKVKSDVDKSSHSLTPPSCVHKEIDYVGNIYIGSALAGL